jgi:DNA-binding MarR family transcriptional regulator
MKSTPKPPRGAPAQAVPTKAAARAMDALRRIVRGLRVSSRAAERELGLSSAQLFVLQRLAEEPGASLGRLAERTLTDPSSVSVVLARLVERGLVRRGTAPDDARRLSLSLTAAGRALVRRAPEPAQARLAAALERLPSARKQALASDLEAVAEAMGAGAEAPMFFEEEARPRARAAKRARRTA